MEIKPFFVMASLWFVEISDSLRDRERESHDLTGIEENWIHSKKKTYGYCERDEAKRQAFIAQLSMLPPETIVYLALVGHG